MALPKKEPVVGDSITLERLSLVHLDDLWPLAAASPGSFAHLRYGPFGDKSDLKAVLEDL